MLRSSTLRMIYSDKFKQSCRYLNEVNIEHSYYFYNLYKQEKQRKKIEENEKFRSLEYLGETSFSTKSILGF